MNKLTILLMIAIIIVGSFFLYQKITVTPEESREEVYMEFISKLENSDTSGIHNFFSKSLQQKVPLERVEEIFNAIEFLDIEDADIKCKKLFGKDELFC